MSATTNRQPTDPTPRQERFARIYATTELNATECFRLAYPSASGRKPATEHVAASRLLRNPRVIRAIERASMLDPERMKQEALAVLGRINEGELDPRHSAAALARLREANRALREQAARAKTAERDLAERQQQEG